VISTGSIPRWAGDLDELDNPITAVLWPCTYGGPVGAHRWIVGLERLWDATRRRQAGSRVPAHFRIEPYIGHGGTAGVAVRGRVLDDPTPSEPVEGEGVVAATRRTVRNFLTDELPGVPLRVVVGGASVETVTDSDGYFHTRLQPEPDDLTTPWTSGTVELAGRYRGLTDGHLAPVEVRVAGAGARFGVISDVDDTILQTGVQRVGQMIRQTFTGSALTRTPFRGAADLYRDLEAEGNPVFYVSSSPWNLHAFMVAFLRQHEFPAGPVLLCDLLGTSAGREEKTGRIREILGLHPRLPFVLIGDSGEKDPEIYAEIIRSHPGRILAVYIREVRLDPGDGRVEKVSGTWAQDVPFVLAADTDAVRKHAIEIGLL
jgi:phosphatidate phosphatase APP1